MYIYMYTYMYMYIYIYIHSYGNASTALRKPLTCFVQHLYEEFTRLARD